MEGSNILQFYVNEMYKNNRKPQNHNFGYYEVYYTEKSLTY
jgi:hypothetical protein